MELELGLERRAPGLNSEIGTEGRCRFVPGPVQSRQKKAGTDAYRLVNEIKLKIRKYCDVKRLITKFVSRPKI